MHPVTFNRPPDFSFFQRKEQDAQTPDAGLQAQSSSHSRKATDPDLRELLGRINEIDISLLKEIRPVKNPEDVFWRLGDDWWKQLYDAKYHEFGPNVFDEGLHGEDVEPGYYKSAKEASEFACNNIMQSLSVAFYQRLHGIACQHFAGASTCTLMSASEAGKFTSPLEMGINSKGSLLTLFCAYLERFEEIDREFTDHVYNYQLGESLLSEEDQTKKQAILDQECLTLEEAMQKYDQANTWLSAYHAEFNAKLDLINSHIALKSQMLGLTSPICVLEVNLDDPEQISITYECTKEEVDQAVVALFDKYEVKMQLASSKEEKLRLIANLFQMLEWLHPFIDGQGRTDLILLSKELCRHGFNPAILDEPFFSTVSTLDDWVAYLERGMEKWRQQEAALHSPLKSLD